MGGNKTKSGKHIYVYLAGLILLAFSGCATCSGLHDRLMAHNYLSSAKTSLERGDYEKAAQESQKSLDLAGNKSPGDKALFTLGLVYAHYGNAKRDYGKSFGYFRELVSNYPEGPMAERAKIWMGVLEIIEKMKQVDIELEKKKKEWIK